MAAACALKGGGLVRIYFALLFVGLLITPATSHGQTTDPKWTFGGMGGWGKTWDDEGGIGSGWVIGGYVDRKLSKNVDLEFAADLVANTRTDNFEADGKTTYLSTQLIRRFGSRQANGFVMGGGALAIHNGTTQFSDGSFRTEHNSTNPGLIWGGGLSFRTGNDIEIAPIVRMTLMFIDNDSDPWSSISVGVRVGFSR